MTGARRLGAGVGYTGRTRMDDQPPTDAPDSESPSTPPDSPAANEASPAEARFRSCRWRKTPDGGGVSYCAHRDVLPFAGALSFKADAWCPDCKFYKLRRSPRKRPGADWQA